MRFQIWRICESLKGSLFHVNRDAIKYWIIKTLRFDISLLTDSSKYRLNMRCRIHLLSSVPSWFCFRANAVRMIYKWPSQPPCYNKINYKQLICWWSYFQVNIQNSGTSPKHSIDLLYSQSKVWRFQWIFLNLILFILALR